MPEEQEPKTVPELQAEIAGLQSEWRDRRSEKHILINDRNQLMAKVPQPEGAAAALAQFETDINAKTDDENTLHNQINALQDELRIAQQA